MKTLGRSLLLAIMAFGLDCHAYPFVTVKTTCGTNGWFEYELAVHNDPFWNQVDSMGLAALQVTNVQDVGAIPSGWINAVSTNAIVWSYSGTLTDPVARPQVIHMSFQSPHTAFRRAPNALCVMFSAYPQMDIYPRENGVAPSVNIVGYRYAEGLVPCAQSEADGSPPAMTTTWDIVPDIRMTDFLAVSNQLQGVNFTWNSTFTMGVDASWDMTSWSNVACVIGDAGTNTWTSSVPLDQVGKYFRLRLYSSDKHPEMVY